jgi:glutathione S-transferase
VIVHFCRTVITGLSILSGDEEKRILPLVTEGTAIVKTSTGSKLKVYSHVLSGHAHRVRLMLSLLQLPHEVVEVPIPDFKAPWFLAKNPLGQIPVLEDGDFVLADSTAILVYLATKYDNGTWLPREPEKAAAVQRWLSFASGSIFNGPNKARLAKKFSAPIDHAGAKTIAENFFAYLDVDLAGKKYSIGDHPTIADVAAYSYIALAPEGGISLDPYPNVRTWLRRVEALPLFIPMAGVVV